MHDPNHIKPKTLTQGILLIVLVFAILIVGTVIFDTFRDYRQTRALTFEKIRSYRIALAEHASISFESTRAVLDSIHKFLEGGKKLEAYPERAIHSFTKNLITGLPQIGWVNIKDGEAVNVANSLKYPTPKNPHKDLDYIQYHQNNRSLKELYFSKPATGIVTGKWRFFITRRLIDSNGSFGGVVGCAFDPGYYTDFYNRLELGTSGRIALLRTDGTPLVMTPLTKSSMQLNLKDEGLLKVHLTQNKVGDFQGNMRGSFFDNHFVSYQKLGKYPVVAVVAIGYDEAMQPWRSRSIVKVGLAMAVLLITIWFSNRLLKYASSLKQTSTALSLSESRYRALFEESMDAIFETTLDGTILELNPAGLKLIGYEPAEIATLKLGEDIYQSAADRDRFIEAIERRGYVNGFEVDIITKGAELKSTIISATGVKEAAGNLVGFRGIIRDITDEKQVQQRLQHTQRMESIGTLAGGIAHDFNNLLLPIITLSELLMENMDPDSDAYHDAQVIRDAGLRGGELVKQILAFSRESTHEQILLRIQSIVKEAFKLSRATIPANIEMALDIQGECGLVLADPTHVNQITMNLITNAYHAVETTGGNVVVRLEETEVNPDTDPPISSETGSWARLSVIDTGCGIEPALIEKIFEPYFSTKEKEKGTGLGLAVVYGIVKDSGGDIQVRSKPGQGTTIDVYLPVIEKARNLNKTQPVKSVKSGQEMILLVDDDAAIIQANRRTLEHYGYRVAAYTSSGDALEAFKAAPNDFDIVVTDMSMPTMTGDELARALFSVRADIPVILLTGFSERMNSEKAKAIGLSGFLMKPVLMSELVGKIRNILDG